MRTSIILLINILLISLGKPFYTFGKKHEAEAIIIRNISLSEHVILNNTAFVLQEELSFEEEWKKIFIAMISSGQPSKIVALYESAISNLGIPKGKNDNYYAALSQVTLAYGNLNQTEKQSELTIKVYEYQKAFSDSEEVQAQAIAMLKILDNAQQLKTDQQMVSEKAKIENATEMESIRTVTGVDESAQTQLTGEYMADFHEKNLNAILPALDSGQQDEVLKIMKQMTKLMPGYDSTQEKETAMETMKYFMAKGINNSLNYPNRFMNDLRDNPAQNLIFCGQIVREYTLHKWLNIDYVTFFENIGNTTASEDLTFEEASLLAAKLWKEELIKNNHYTEDSIKLFESLVQRSFQEIWNQDMRQMKSQYHQLVEIKKQHKAKVPSIEEYLAENINFFSQLSGSWEFIEHLPFYEIVYEELKKANDLIGFDDISKVVSESELLEQLAKHRQVNLNVSIKAHKKGIANLFEDGDYFDANRILASKGADYKSKLFTLKAVQSSADTIMEKMYDSIRVQRAELSSLLIIPDTLWKNLGWSKEKFEEATILNKERYRALYKIISHKVDFIEYAQEWIISWQEIQQLLKPNEAFLDIEKVVSLDPPYTASYLFLIVKPDSTFVHIIDNKSGERNIEKEFLAYRNHVNSKRYYEPSYEVFWKPIANYLNGIQKIYLSPDGIYHSIALEGLKLENSDRFLAEDLEIVRIVDISEMRKILISVETKEIPITNISIFGYPDYNNPSPEDLTTKENKYRSLVFATKTRNTEPLKPLLGSLGEVDTLAYLSKKVKINTSLFKETDASEYNFDKLQSPTILHLATHGKFFGEIGKENERFLAGSKTDVFHKNPLLKTHLYLAGANLTLKGHNSSGKDGIVSAEEIMHMDFNNTELVTLSACETALGETVSGEGVFGLQRAFIMAGSKSVITTLWEVNDLATQNFMTNFYKCWLVEKKTKTEAFNTAREVLMSNPRFRDPIFWAPFIMIGI